MCEHLTFEQMISSIPKREKKPYFACGFWNNPLELKYNFGFDFSYEKPVTRELLNTMKSSNTEEFFKTINNELIFEQIEGYHSQLWDLLTEEERVYCIDFHSDNPMQTISEAALGCGDKQAFHEMWTLDSALSKETLETLQKIKINNSFMNNSI